MHIAHLRRLKQAMDRRDERVGQIARRLVEHQRRMLNLAVQLQALYEGRREDVAGLLKKGGGGGRSKAVKEEEGGLRGDRGRVRPLGERVVAAG
ncbi:hypothetical protein N658DRAFT_492425 [Parathielavia hyrcaniae]|uniref:Uncharacterized protein n=1 Tax=Parathielavia hyrcaniae TaxID=113614 RepID=A0AAN6T6I9_9PEZI|nr:hypothetical protein N658DRAFT_492425 [Parathielavia hyrcaniae]